MGLDHLVVINQLNGILKDKGVLSGQGDAVQDMEDLTLYNTKILYGTTDNGFVENGTGNRMYSIDKKDGCYKTYPSFFESMI